MSLGQHLRAEQQSGFATPDQIQPAFDLTLAPGRVTINAHDLMFGMLLSQCLFKAFGALAHRHQVGRIAMRAGGRYGMIGAAVVAGQPCPLQVINEPGITAPTLDKLAAVGTQHAG